MDAVLAHLRDAIERGQYAVGGKLPSEAVLSRDFAVSRSVVREALRGLQALGLTVSRTGRGTFVVSDRPAHNPRFGDLLRARPRRGPPALVEVPQRDTPRTRHSPDDLDALDRAARADGTRDRRHRLGRAGLAVPHRHRPASGNPVFAKVIEEIRDALARQSAFLNQLGGRREGSNAEHRRIVEAIVAGSREAAISDTVHLDHVETAVTDIVGTETAAP